MKISKTTVKSVRKASGLSQEGAARLINVSTASWQAWELGRRQMSRERLDAFKIAVMEIKKREYWNEHCKGLKN